MKRAVDIFAFILQIVGVVSLGLYGISLSQRHDPSGIAVLTLLACGLVLTLVHGWSHQRGVRNARRMLAGKPFRSRTFQTTVTAEYTNSAAEVWALIRPAQVAVLTGGASHAFKVPGTPDGEGERQCFISGDGQVSCIEVVKEIPFRSAVTKSICSPLHPSVETTYTLNPDATGCSLTMSVVVESPVALDAAQKHTFRAHTASFVEKVGHLLDGQFDHDIPATSSGA